jgi:hypothetical protein
MTLKEDIKNDEQEHEHPEHKDQETPEIGNATRGEDVAASVIVTIALRVRVVKMIVRFSYVHRESAETPLSGIRGECKLEEPKN